MKGEMEEILETAFRRARVEGGKGRGLKGNAKFERTLEIKKIETASTYVNQRLNALEKRIPRIDKLHAFHKELLEGVIGTEKLKKTASHLVESQKIINRIRRKCVREIHLTKNFGKMRDIRKQFYGRMASVLRSVGESYSFLMKASFELKKMPNIKFDCPCVIIAGIPNTGKSTLLKRLTHANPEIAEYPFTTKLVQLGHVEERRGKLQFIDTPGLLDRPAVQRNEIEKRAISAIRHLASLIVFVVDPTGRCGYSLKEQDELFRALREEFGKKFIVALNKCDIASREELETARSVFSEEEITIEGKGMPSKLLDRIFSELKEEQGKPATA